MIKPQIKVVLWIIIALLLINYASALGVTPARKIVDYEPGRTETITLTILNNENKEMKTMLYPDGKFSELTDLKPTLITLKANEPSKQFTFSLNMPAEGVLKPGMNEIKINVLEFPGNFNPENQAQVSASIELIFQLRINVPYPGKYAEADMFITAGNINEPVDFTIPIYNFGSEDINEISGAIEILGPTNERIAMIATNNISLKAKAEGKIVARLYTKLNAGNYHAIARIDYDGKRIKLEKNFNVGELTIDITGIEVNDFTLGTIAKLDILLYSQWNQKISDVYGDLEIKDKNGNILTRFKTASTDIEAKSKGMIEGYWNTENVDPGTYDINIMLNYAGKVTEKIMELQVGFNSIRAGMIPTGRIIGEEDSFVKQNSVLILLVLVLIIINIGWFIYFSRRRKRVL